MSLIKLTSKQRNGKTYQKDVLINLDRVAEPIIENVSNDSIISLNETPSLQNHVNQGANKVQYIVDEDMATIVALSNKEMFVGTILSRNGKSPVESSVIFIVKNITGKIEEDTLGCRFLYEEEGDPNPVEYILSETITDIATALS